MSKNGQTVHVECIENGRGCASDGALAQLGSPFCREETVRQMDVKAQWGRTKVKPDVECGIMISKTNRCCVDMFN